MIDHISFTQINCMLTCGRKYWFQYVQGIKTPATPSLIRGIVFHKGMEHNFRQKIETGRDLPIEDVLNAAKKAWGKVLSEQRTGIDWQDQAPSDVRDQTMRLIAIYMERQAPFVMPRSVEEEFHVMLPGLDIEVTGRIDLTTVEEIITDYKTASKPASELEFQDDLQATMYGAWRLTDPAVQHVDVQQHVVREDPKKSEIRNPQILKTTRTREDVEWSLQHQLVPCVEQIRAGIFPARNGGWQCSKKWCGCWSICKVRGGAS